MPDASSCDEWKSRPLYWSTLGYLRAWLWSDGPRLAEIRHIGRIEPPMMRNLGAEYNVNRSILRPEKGPKAPDPNGEAVCALLDDEVRAGFPPDILDRAEQCKGLAEKMKPYAKGQLLLSAASKFTWFLAPQGWTPIDRFALLGLGFKSTNDPGRLKDFASALKAQGFNSLVREMRDVILEGPVPTLPPERVIDTLLMARGGRDGDPIALRRIKTFLSLLPKHTSAQVEALAAQLDFCFHPHSLASAEARS